jgi:hypothetical protein
MMSLTSIGIISKGEAPSLKTGRGRLRLGGLVWLALCRGTGGWALVKLSAVTAGLRFIHWGDWSKRAKRNLAEILPDGQEYLILFNSFISSMMR